MTAAPIETIEVAGFRAFLEKQVLAFESRSVALFGRNAYGKSSLVDAVDFYFSADGAVQRLTERKGSVEASRASLPNVRAAAAKRPSYVTMKLTKRDPDSRLVTTLLPSGVAQSLLKLAPVRFIIRGNELRAFVEDLTPQKRYEKLADWLGLDRLVKTQDALRATRLALGRSATDRSKFAEIDTAARSATRNQLVTWDEKTAIAWLDRTYHLSTRISPTIAALDASDPGVIALDAAARSETRTTGLEAVSTISKSLAALTAGTDVDGSLQATLGAFRAAEDARNRYERERAACPTSAFKAVWEAATAALMGTEEDACPVCTTPFVASPLSLSKA